MANARIYYAPATPRGIVVGEEIPPEILARAREAEQQRRERTRLDVEAEEQTDDFDWIETDGQANDRPDGPGR